MGTSRVYTQNTWETLLKPILSEENGLHRPPAETDAPVLDGPVLPTDTSLSHTTRPLWAHLLRGGPCSETAYVTGAGSYSFPKLLLSSSFKVQTRYYKV